MYQTKYNFYPVELPEELRVSVVLEIADLDVRQAVDDHHNEVACQSINIQSINQL